MKRVVQTFHISSQVDQPVQAKPDPAQRNQRQQLQPSSPRRETSQTDPGATRLDQPGSRDTHSHTVQNQTSNQQTMGRREQVRVKTIPAMPPEIKRPSNNLQSPTNQRHPQPSKQGRRDTRRQPSPQQDPGQACNETEQHSSIEDQVRHSEERLHSAHDVRGDVPDPTRDLQEGSYNADDIGRDQQVAREPKPEHFLLVNHHHSLTNFSPS